MKVQPLPRKNICIRILFMFLKSFLSKRSQKRVFLDYASTTPVSAEVAKVMEPFASERFHNPGALYKEGVEARRTVESARAQVAKLLNVTSAEVFFTSGGTESDNLAIAGVFAAALKRGIQSPHIMTTTIEHPAVLEVCKNIEKAGGKVTYLTPDEEGIVEAQKVKAALTPETILVSVMYANNEIGTVQPIKEIAKEVQTWRGSRKSKYPFFHTDASQAPNYLSVQMQTLGADLLTIDAGKIYGPKGVGALVVKRNTEISAVTFGGGQEGGLRPGTENVAGIVGFAKALDSAISMREKETERISKLSSDLLQRILKEVPGAELNGHREKRLPNIVNICIKGLDSEFAVLKMDNLGVACAHVTSCKTSAEDSSSYVVGALGKKECTKSSLRFSLGRETTKKDLDFALEALKKIV